MSNKGKRVAAMAEQFREGKLDPHYIGYFDCSTGRFFTRRTTCWNTSGCKDKHGPNGAFYKGLIQLAGAFVHLQKNRLRPAAALFKLALANLEKYPPLHEHLNLKTYAQSDSKVAGRSGAGAFRNQSVNAR